MRAWAASDSRLGQAVVVVVALTGAVAAGCSSSADTGVRGDPANAGTGSLGEAGASDGDEAVPESLAFVPGKTLELSPKQVHTLTLKTTPAGVYRVRFALTGADADGVLNDAVLDASELDTDAAGLTQVVLTAPSAPTTFSVRASVAGKVPTFLGVSVSSTGFTTLRVKPSYAGHRAVSLWTASARTGSKCKKLVGNPPPDGDLVVSAKAGAVLDIEHVPIGAPLTVTLRAGHYIGGCTDQPALTEAEGQEAQIFASDREVNFADTRVDLTLGPSDIRPEFTKMMKDSALAAEAALAAGAQSDVQALLNAMRDVTLAVNREAFTAARSAKSWDQALASALGPGSETVLRDHADRWLSAGLANFEMPDTFFGQLAADPTGPSGARYNLSRIAGLAPSDAGFTSQVPSMWSADSSDTLVLGMQLEWLPSRLVTALAARPALLEYSQASSVEDALAQSLSCTVVSRALLANGTMPAIALYPGCDESCGRSTCESAVHALWAAVEQSSGSNTARLSVTATASAEVGDEAQITSLMGSWIGALDNGSANAAVSGALSAFGVGL